MPITTVAAVIPVADLDAALPWYQRLLGRPADSQPMEGLAEWQITKTGSIQLVSDADRAGAALLTLFVDDLEGDVAMVAKRDLPVSSITTGDMARFATIADPEGNTITFAEPLVADS